MGVKIPAVYKTKLRGLLGNFDNDQENDFITRSGDKIPSDSSDIYIFDNFCKTCKYLPPIVHDNSSLLTNLVVNLIISYNRIALWLSKIW